MAKWIDPSLKEAREITAKNGILTKKQRREVYLLAASNLEKLEGKRGLTWCTLEMYLNEAIEEIYDISYLIWDIDVWAPERLIFFENCPIFGKLKHDANNISDQIMMFCLMAVV